MNLKKLYIVTGKGGVGKTVTALALAALLQEKTNKKVVYNCFDEVSNKVVTKSLGLKTLDLPLIDSTIEYVSRKLGSETIAKWIVKAPFFKALFNIVPSLGNMITLGHLIDKLKKDDDLIIVLDAPSSGHILTVLESPKNFEAIFKTGRLIDDIHGMIDFLTKENTAETWVMNIPTELAITEGEELRQKLEDFGLKNIRPVLNNSLLNTEYGKVNDLPEFLARKLANEKDVIENNQHRFNHIIPMFIENSPVELVKSIKNNIKGMIS
jgi:anion-transporting  ArsA/GET3 family ATPase